MATQRKLASKALTPELRALLVMRTDLFLCHIVATNQTSQYASQTSSLAPFRDAIEHDAAATADVGTTLLRAFRDHVPLTDYTDYKSWIARFDENPCTEERVKDLFAPGLPYYFAMSSATSGKEPKLFPVYQHAHIGYPVRPIIDFSDTRGPTAWIFYYGYRGIKEVERGPGLVVKRILMCLTSTGMLRMRFGWDTESDESRLSTIMPTQVAPWGANMITHSRSFLLIHALFCLACSDLDQIFVTFGSFFLDFIRSIDEEWVVFLTCIREGRIPDLDGITHLHDHLQVAFSANPARADELREVGPPSSGSGWAVRAWPRLRRLVGVFSGTFGTCLPQVTAILGPTIAIRSHGYGSSESCMSVYFNPDDIETFVFESEDVVEFLEADAEAIQSNILQGWDLEAGKRYQIVVTTRNGLWRYLLDDIIEIIGFDPHNGSPVFKYFGRKTSVIRLPHVIISDTELVAAIRAVSSQEYIQVLDFTAILDERKAPQTIGFIVELSGKPGPSADLTARRLFDILATGNKEYQDQVQCGETRPPTIRIVAPGTFMNYRRWRGEKMNVGLGQIKVPVVMSHGESQEWILGKVTKEL